MKSKKDIGYDEAMAELQGILQGLQNGEIGIDDLEAKVRRATEIIQFCREKLRQTEKAVEDLENNTAEKS